MYLVYVFAAFFLLSIAWVGWQGGAPERIVAAAYLIAWIASILVEPFSAARFDHVLAVTAGIDLLLLILLVMVTMRTSRRWAAIASGFQAIIVLAHLVKALSPDSIRLVYMVLTNLWPILQILLLVAGTIAYRAHRRAMKSTGS